MSEKTTVPTDNGPKHSKKAEAEDAALDAKFAAIARGVKTLCDAGMGAQAAGEIACHLVCGTSPGTANR